MKRKANASSKAKRSKLSKPKKKPSVSKKKKKTKAPLKENEVQIGSGDFDDTDSEEFPVSKLEKSGSEESRKAPSFDREVEKSRYEAFWKALNSFNHTTYGTSKDRNVVANPTVVTDELLQAEIGVKEFMHMVYTNNAFFPDKLFQDFELGRVGVFVNFTMNGPFPSIALENTDDRNRWHETGVRRPWTFPITPDYARKVVGDIRNTDGPANFQHDTLVEHTTIPKSFFTHGTGTLFMGIWDMKKLESRCEEFNKKGSGKTRDLKNEFRSQINKDCEELMFDPDTRELKKEILTDPDTGILASAFGRWWGERLKSVKEEEGDLEDKQTE